MKTLIHSLFIPLCSLTSSTSSFTQTTYINVVIYMSYLSVFKYFSLVSAFIYTVRTLSALSFDTGLEEKTEESWRVGVWAAEMYCEWSYYMVSLYWVNNWELNVLFGSLPLCTPLFLSLSELEKEVHDRQVALGLREGREKERQLHGELSPQAQTDATVP